MNKKIYALLIMTAIVLFVAPQAATLDLIMPIPVLMLFLIMGFWLTLVTKMLSNYGGI
jgi:hypothetical protein